MAVFEGRRRDCGNSITMMYIEKNRGISIGKWGNVDLGSCISPYRLPHSDFRESDDICNGSIDIFHATRGFSRIITSTTIWRPTPGPGPNQRRQPLGSLNIDPPPYEERDPLFPLPARIPPVSDPPSSQQVSSFQDILKFTTTLTIPILSYRNNILAFNATLGIDPAEQPSLSNPQICQKYHEQYVGLSEDLKPFVKVFPGLADIVYNTIPCHIVSWLYASGDPVERFNHLEESRRMLDVQLEEFIRRDLPVYLSDFTDYFDIKWARGGNLFARVRKGSLYDCIERLMSFLAQIQKSPRMKDLLQGALFHAQAEQLKIMLQAGKFELRDEVGQLRRPKSATKEEEKEAIKIYDEGTSDENEDRSGYTESIRGIEPRPKIDEISLSESQNEFITSMLTSDDETSAVLENVQRLAASIKVPDVLISHPMLGTDGGSDVGIPVSDDFGDSRFKENIKIDDFSNESDDSMSIDLEDERGNSSGEAMMNLLEESTEQETSPTDTPMEIDSPEAEREDLYIARMRSIRGSPMEIDSIPPEPVTCPKYKTARHPNQEEEQEDFAQGTSREEESAIKIPSTKIQKPDTKNDGKNDEQGDNNKDENEGENSKED
ncbi:hypothetical protein TWF694_011250 [Orbilia ellipsospora]|uniref:Uncharacterized protein n=1 Tax=Orbilia ellipsospora TaxID=2528407 RepID=A0AAV9X8J1_9PEZI